MAATSRRRVWSIPLPTAGPAGRGFPKATSLPQGGGLASRLQTGTHAASVSPQTPLGPSAALFSVPASRFSGPSGQRWLHPIFIQRAQWKEILGMWWVLRISTKFIKRQVLGSSKLYSGFKQASLHPEDIA